MELRALRKIFPIRGGILQRTVAEVVAVDGVDLTIRKGETLGVYDNPVGIIPAVLPYLVGPGLVFVPGEGHAVQVLRQVRKVQLSPYDPRRPARVCTGPGLPQPTKAVDHTAPTTTTTTTR